MLMGKWLGYKKEERRRLGIAAVLHDIGKILIPIEILNKPASLTSTEYSMMKEHAKFGFDILNNSDSIDDSIKRVVLYHHERMDGSGYPFGLHGSQLDEKTKIVGICDVYDAVTSKRVYKDKVNPLKGLKIIHDCSYDILDTYLCRLFLDNVAKTYHGCKAILNNDRICKIIRIFTENPTKPWVVIDETLYNLAEFSELEIVDII
jgi:HD-GYP domain-containing protein (c-di-GMP phosphodiesterase class II)